MPVLLFSLLGVLLLLVGALITVRYMRGQAPNGPPQVFVGLPIVGTAKAFTDRTVDFVKECQEKYGNAFTLDMLVFKKTFIFEEDDLKRFFDGSEKEVTNTLFEAMLDPLFGAMTENCKKGHRGPDGLESNEMKHLLHFLAPNIMRHIVTYVEDVTVQLVRQWAQADYVDLFQEVSNIVLNANIRFTLGKNAEPYIPELSQLIRELEETLVDPMLAFPGSSCRKRAARIREGLHDIIGNKIWNKPPSNTGQAQDGDNNGKEEDEEEGGGVARDFDVRQFRAPFHADQDIIRLAIGVIFASHVNTVNSTSWAITDLCNHPEWLQRCREEQQAHIAKRLAEGQEEEENEGNSIGVPFKFEDHAGFPVLTQCWRESVRLRANLLLLRQVRDDWPVLKGRFVVPKGEVVAVCPFLLGRDPQFWPSPEEYDPTRFAPGFSLPNKYQFIQWGFGTHRCKGEKLGSLEAKVILGVLLRGFDFSLVEPGTPAMDTQKKLFGPPQPQKPVLLRVKPL